MLESSLYVYSERGGRKEKEKEGGWVRSTEKSTFIRVVAINININFTPAPILPAMTTYSLQRTTPCTDGIA